jgi:hypothetical protein
MYRIGVLRAYESPDAVLRREQCAEEDQVLTP